MIGNYHSHETGAPDWFALEWERRLRNRYLMKHEGISILAPRDASLSPYPKLVLTILQALLSSILALFSRFFTMNTRPLRLWREVAALSLLGMGLSWGVPWFRSLSLATYFNSPVRVFSILGGMGLAAFGITKLLANLHWHAKYRQRATLFFLALAILVGLKVLLYSKDMISWTALIMRPLWAISNFAALIPNEFLIIMTVLLVWRQGAVLAHEYVGPESVERAFKIGFAMFLFFAGVNTFVTGETVPTVMLQSFFFFSLLAMGAARIWSLGELRGGTRAPFETRRIFSLIIPMLAVVFFANGMAILMTQKEAAFPALVLGLLVITSLFFSLPILLILLYGLFYLIYNYRDIAGAMLERITETFARFLEALQKLRDTLIQLAELLAEKFAFLAPIFRWFFALAPVVRVLALVGSIALVTFFIFLALYIRESRRRKQLTVELDTILTMGDFLTLLRQAFQSRMESVAGVPDVLREIKKRRAAARIRQIYIDLIDLSTERGKPRPDAVTPLEFLPVLKRLFPTHAEELSTITDAYIRVRYGELLETQAEVRKVEQAWRAVCQSWKRS